MAFSTQSGALGLAILEYAQRVNLGISTFVSIGNKADVSSNDLLQYWDDDPQHRTSSCCTWRASAIRASSARSRARSGAHKPIVAVKAGPLAAGARAASSHTGALAASDTLVDALFRDAGVIRTDDARRAVRCRDAARASAAARRAARRDSHQRRRARHPRGRRVRGARPAASRRCSIDTIDRAAGVSAGRREVCTTRWTCWRRRRAEHYAARDPLLLADPGVDSLLTIFIPPLVTAAADAARRSPKPRAARQKPVLATFLGVDDAVRDAGADPVAIGFPKPASRARARCRIRAVAVTAGGQHARLRAEVGGSAHGGRRRAGAGKRLADA